MKPPTGAGLIGQVGAKPGGSVAGSVLPPREGLYDPRQKYGYTTTGSRIQGAHVLGLVALILVALAIGFILGRTL